MHESTERTVQWVEETSGRAAEVARLDAFSAGGIEGIKKTRSRKTSREKLPELAKDGSVVSKDPDPYRMRIADRESKTPHNEILRTGAVSRQRGACDGIGINAFSLSKRTQLRN